MSSIFLSPEIFIELFLEFLLLLVMGLAFVQSIKLLKSTDDFHQSYEIEKKSYLTFTLISVSLVIKIILLVFFIYGLDELSSIIPGAMCVTGVLESNVYGTPLLLLKLGVLLMISLWLMLRDFKNKIIFFIIIYLFIILEFVLSLSFLSFIDVSTKVSCCLVKFIQEDNYLPFNISRDELLYLFVGSYFLLFINGLLKYKKLLFISTLVFMYTSYYAIVYYFGSFIYGDASHKCPFCMLKQEYNFIGYIIYISLFLTSLYSLSMIMFSNTQDNNKKVLFFSSLIVLVLFAYLLLDSTY